VDSEYGSQTFETEGYIYLANGALSGGGTEYEIRKN
jgi:hypothetical protein